MLVTVIIGVHELAEVKPVLVVDLTDRVLPMVVVLRPLGMVHVL